MHCFQKASLVKPNRIVVVFVCIIIAVLISNNVDAQDTGTVYSQKNVGYRQPINSLFNDTEDLLGFFFYVQESYFSSHFVYSNDFETMLRYGKSLSPILYNQIMDCVTSFRVECDNLEMSIFYNNDTLVAFKRNVNYQDFCRKAQLRNFVRLFDDSDLVIDDTNIFMEYSAQKRDLLIILHEKYGYDVDMVMLPLCESDIEKKEYPLTILFVYDSSGLIVHPLYNEYKFHIDNDFKRHLAQMADSLCSKYNATKIIFSSQIMSRKKKPVESDVP